MAQIPERVKKQSLIRSLFCHLLSQGKVGDQYNFPSTLKWLIAVRSNRLSVFDFVLLLLVSCKGQVLTALTDFWARELLTPLGIQHHLVKSEMYPGRNMAKDLKQKFSDVDLTRTLVIKRAKIMPFEMIFRGHLGGSVWKTYLENDGIVAGVQLPKGLKKWQKLETPLFTPSTKADGGHDVNITQKAFFAETGEAGLRAVEMLTKLYEAAYKFCEIRGILLLDTKFEVNSEGQIVCDEFLTPDSSRFVSKDNFLQAFHSGKEPDFMDKQPARDYCATIETPFLDNGGNKIIGFKNLDPENPEHVRFVSNYEIPEEVAQSMTKRYLEIFEILTGMSLPAYQEKYLN
jgi:phosphoribosylaminoimidazole-succinocarboxamide synthase